MIFLHGVHLVRVSAVNYMERLVSLIVFLSVLVMEMGCCGSHTHTGGLSVRVARKALGERVPHLELAVGHAAHGGLLHVERAVSYGALACG